MNVMSSPLSVEISPSKEPSGWSSSWPCPLSAQIVPLKLNSYATPAPNGSEVLIKVLSAGVAMSSACLLRGLKRTWVAPVRPNNWSGRWAITPPLDDSSAGAQASPRGRHRQSRHCPRCVRVDAHEDRRFHQDTAGGVRQPLLQRSLRVPPGGVQGHRRRGSRAPAKGSLSIEGIAHSEYP